VYESETLAQHQTSLLLFWVVYAVLPRSIAVVGRHASGSGALFTVYCIQTTRNLLHRRRSLAVLHVSRQRGNKQTPIHLYLHPATLPRSPWPARGNKANRHPRRRGCELMHNRDASAGKSLATRRQDEYRSNIRTICSWHEEDAQSACGCPHVVIQAAGALWNHGARACARACASGWPVVWRRAGMSLSVRQRERASPAPVRDTVVMAICL
jgi:hypothetical protein